jgi:RNA polymerase sigma-70 factor (ECF subfamily)
MADTPSKVNITKVDIAQLVADHHRAVYQYAYRLTGAVQDAEDLTQHVFLVAQSHIGELRSVDSARSWLFTILRNRFLKDRQRRRPVPVADLQLDIDTIPDLPLTEEIDLESLQKALNRLSDGFRLILVMFYFENCSYRQISDQLGVPLGTVMSRLARAKASLRTLLFEAETRDPSQNPTRSPLDTIESISP